MLSTAYTHSGTIFANAGGCPYFVKPICVLSAAVTNVVVDDVMVDVAVDTIVGGLQGGFVFFEMLPIKDIHGVITQTLHVRANVLTID